MKISYEVKKSDSNSISCIHAYMTLDLNYCSKESMLREEIVPLSLPSVKHW